MKSPNVTLTIDDVEAVLPTNTTWRNLFQAHEAIRLIPGGPVSYGLTRLALCLRKHRTAPIPGLSEESIREEAKHFQSPRGV